MHLLNPPPKESRIRVDQNQQQVRIQLPISLTFNGLMALGLILISFAFGQASLQALQTESLWTGAVLLPWLLALGLGLIALLLLLSKPVFYIDPPGRTGTFRLQWAVTTVVINQQRLQLQLYTPFRRQWLGIPIEHILAIEQFDERYTVLLRRKHDRYSILRGQHQDYLLSTELTSAEQTWLVTELTQLLRDLQHRDR